MGPQHHPARHRVRGAGGGGTAGALPPRPRARRRHAREHGAGGRAEGEALVPGRAGHGGHHGARGPGLTYSRSATATPSRVGSMAVRKPGWAISRRVNSTTPRVAADPSSSPSRTRPDHRTLSVMNRPPRRRWAWARSTVAGYPSLSMSL